MTTNSPARPIGAFQYRLATLLALTLGLAIATQVRPLAAAEDTGAWAAGLKNLSPTQGRTLLKVAQDLFRDKGFEDAKFTACITPYDAAAGDPQAREATEEALKMVQDGTRRMGYTAYVDITDEEERVRLANNLADGRWLRQFKKAVGQCLEAQRK